MTFTIKRGFVVALFAVLFIALATGAAGYLVGQASRKSDATVSTLVNHRVSSAIAATNAERDIVQIKVIKQAKTAQYKKDNKRWNKRLKKAVKASYDKGYTRGNSTGYSAGTTAGFNSGKVAGVDEGIEKASDDLICSDDPDANLPPCFF